MTVDIKGLTKFTFNMCGICGKEVPQDAYFRSKLASLGKTKKGVEFWQSYHTDCIMNELKGDYFID